MIDAYILIGGRSSRFGSDKALAELGGQSLAKKTRETVHFAKLFDRITFVAADEAQFAIPAVPLGARFIFDIYPDRGPLSGLHAALVDAKTEWIFITACDYPSVTPDLVEVLGAKLEDDFSVVVPQQEDGRIQPLFGFYRTRPAMRIVSEIVEGQKQAPPMRNIVQRLSPRIVTFDEYRHLENARMMFANVNTPDDLAARQRSL